MGVESNQGRLKPHIGLEVREVVHQVPIVFQLDIGILPPPARTRWTESPIHISIGQRPMSGISNTFKDVWGVPNTGRFPGLSMQGFQPKKKDP